MTVIEPSGAQRVRVVFRLKEALRDGTLTFEEFENHLYSAYAAVTVDELESVVAHLPQSLGVAVTVQQPKRQHRTLVAAVLACALAVVVMAIVGYKQLS